jgi:hypothetical protein
VQAYPVTYHRIGDTWDRTQRYALPSGTWTPASIARTSAGVLVQTFAATLTALGTPDADGNTHVLNTVATATQTAAWPLATLICDTTFTDASATPVVRSAEAFGIAATAHLPPVLDEYATLAVIPGDLVALLRGEQGPAGATGATGATGAAGAGVPTGGTTGQVLAKASNADRDTAWVNQTGGGGGATNLSYTASATSGVVVSDTGTDATIPAADATNAGLLTPAQFSKLAATSGTNTGDQDLSGYSLTSHAHTGTYDPAGTASSALSSHTAAGDPHPQYALESALGTAAAASTSDFTPAAHAGSGGTAHADAIASGASGFMTGADKAKLDGVAAGAQVNPASTDAVPEGSTNLYSTSARIRATLLTGLSTATATVVSATHTVLEAVGFLQKQVSDNATAITAKQDTLVSGSSIKTVNGVSLLGSGNLSVTADLTAPGPIGGTTPSTVAATTITASGAVTATKLVAQRSNNAAIVESGTTSADYRMRWATGNIIQFCNGDATGFIDVRAGCFEGDWQVGGYGLKAFNGGLYCLTPLLAPSNLTAGALFATGSGYNYDTAFGRSAAGIAEINNGTSGTYRDLKLRNHIGTGANVTGMAAKTADYTLTLNDHAATFDATAAARTATLPALSTVTAGQEYIVIKIDSSANALTLDGNAAETINGAANISTTTQWAALRVKANAGKSAWVTF